jgi:uncharacterized membrane protein
MQIINDYHNRIEDLRASGYKVKIEDYISKGFNIFKKKPEFFILFTLVFFALIPFGGFIVSGPLTAGFFIVAHKLNNRQTVYFENFFDGFKAFIPLFLYTMVSGVLLFLGYLAFVIPGIYLTVAYTFALPLIVFGKMDFWDAMEGSRKLITREWVSIFILVFFLALLNILGALAFGVGLLISFPLSICIIYAAFEDIIGTV